MEVAKDMPVDNALSDEDETSPGEIIVARTTKTAIAIVALFAIPALIAVVANPNILTFAAIVLHLGITYRVSQIRVTVSPDGVIVRNFFSDTFIPLWEADVEVEDQPDVVFLSDAGGKFDTQGRTLYINRPWHNDRINVGIAPRYGVEFDRIHTDLNSAIKLQRAA